MSSIRASTAITLAFVFSAGCGSADPVPQIEKVVPVSGTLTFAGKPLEGFQVTLIPTDGRRAATGVTDASGQFTLGTNTIGDGAPAGQCKLAVVWVGPQVEEIPGQEEMIDNPSRLPKAPVTIPSKYSNPDTSGLVEEIPDGGTEDLKIELR